MIQKVINKFLESNCEKEKKFITNYQDKNICIINYACITNNYKLLRDLKSYFDGDLLEIYLDNSILKLEIIKLLYSKYKDLYLKKLYYNYDKNLNILDFFLEKKKSQNKFKIFCDIGCNKSINLFIKHNYKITKDIFKILAKKNLITIDLLIKNIILLNDKYYIFHIFNYCDTEIINYVLTLNLNLNIKSHDHKNILIYACINKFINLKSVKNIISILDNPFDYDNYKKNCVIYYCYNKNFQTEVFNYFHEKNFRLNKLELNDIIYDNENITTIKSIISLGYEIQIYSILSNLFIYDLNLLKFYDLNFNILKYIDVNEYIYNLINFFCYDIIKYLIKRDIKLINFVDLEDNTLLNLICNNSNNNLNIIEFMILNNIDFHLKNTYGYNCLFSYIIAKSNCNLIFDYLLNLPTLAYSYDFDLNTVFHILILNDYDIFYIKKLYLINKNLDSINDKGNTPLHLCMYNKKYDIAEYLIKNNCSLDIKNISGLTPLDVLITHEQIDIKLVSYFKNIINIKTLFRYLKNDNISIEIFYILLTNTTNIFKKNKDGNNLLLLIAKKYISNPILKIKLFNILDQFKYNFNVLNKNNENALILQMKYNYNYNITKYLIKKKVSTLTKDKNNNNALLYVKDINTFNLIYPKSILRKNKLNQNLLTRLFYINLIDLEFIRLLQKFYDIYEIDKLKKSILDYFLDSINTDEKIFAYLCKYFKITKNYINKILKNKNERLCIYLIKNNLIDINYLNSENKGILDFFSYNEEIISLVENKYILCLNALDNIQNINLLKFIDDNDIDYVFNNTNNLKIKKYIIKYYMLSSETMLKIYNNNNLILDLLNSNKILELEDEDNNNLLMIMLKNRVNFKYILKLVNMKIFNLNHTNKYFRNVLFYATYDLITFKFLIDSGASTNLIDINNENLIFDLCRNNNDIILKYLLLNQNMNINLKNNQFYTPIYYAKNISTIKLLIDFGSYKYIMDITGKTFLNYYCSQEVCLFEIVYLLLDKGYDVNTLDYYDRNPLMNYIKNNNATNIILLFINYNINIQHTDYNGDNALLYLIKHNKNYIICSLMIKYGININLCDKNKKNALFYLNEPDDIKFIKLLINYNINLNQISINGKNYLMNLCSIGLYDIIEFILDYNINLEFLDLNGNNALFYACGIECENADINIIKLLVKNGCNYKLLNYNKNSLLHIAAGVNGYNIIDLDIIDYLLKLNIDTKIINNDGNNYLFYISEMFLTELLNKNILSKSNEDIIELIYTRDYKTLMNYIEYKNYCKVENEDCGICMDAIKFNQIFVKCNNNHYYHKYCLIKWYNTSNKTKCPFCVTRLMINNTKFISI
jgi:ankyrin repeat protein